MTKNRLLAGASLAAAFCALGVTKGATQAGESGGPQRAFVFLPITKIDAKTRTIEARITDETVDSAGEICDYETSAPLFKKWSENAEKVSGGKSKGNVRAMHGPVAAGKLTELTLDDAVKSIDCVLKVVDDAEWEKVDQGVYTGLSLGGNYVGKKWRDPETNAWRYTVDPVEVSLVDLPCNPSATFKAEGLDGETVDKAFKPWTPDKAAVEALATELQKAAGAGVPPDFLEAARAQLIQKRLEGESDTDTAPVAEGEGGGDPAPAAEGEDDADATEAEKAAAGGDQTDWGVEGVFRAKADGSVFTTKKEALAHIAKLKAVQDVGGDDLLAAAIAKAKAAVSGENRQEPAESAPTAVKVEGLEEAVACLKVIAPMVEANPVAVVKGLWDASRALDVLQSVCGLASCAAWEAEWEGDGSAVPGMLASAARSLGEAALAYAQEEIAEAMACLPDLEIGAAVEGMDAVVVELARTGLTAVKANSGLCQKVGARNSSSDSKRIQAIHDAAKELGGACEAEKVEGAEVHKLRGELEVEKANVEKAVVAIGEVTEAVTKMRAELDTTKAELERVKAEPQPMPAVAPGGAVVTRAADPGLSTEQAEKAVAVLVEQLGTDGLARLAMKAAHARPIAVGSGG